MRSLNQGLKPGGGITITEEVVLCGSVQDPKMKINGEFVKREIAGDIILVPTGETALKFNGMITLTETASVIWDLLEKGATKESIISELLNSFEIDQETIRKDVEEFLTALKQTSFLEVLSEESSDA